MTTPDPFDEGVPRGRHNRPLIIPAGRGGKPNLKTPLVEYDRASTVAGALDSGSALGTWKARHAAVGIAGNRDLAGLVAALGRNLNDFTAEDKRNLDAIIERAHDRSGGNEKADYGTTVHSLTEPGNTGTVVIDTMTADVEAYVASIDEAGIVVDSTEVFVVNDDLKVAGTFDHSYRLTRDVEVKVNGETVTLAAGQRLIGDKKTGSLHFDAHAIQEAIYARGKIYDHVTGERTALDVNPQWGIVAHIPREGAEATLYLVDLHEGYRGARLAIDVRSYTLGAKKRLSGVVAKRKVDQPALPAGDGDPFATGERGPEVVAAPVEHVVSQDPGDPAAPADRLIAAPPVDEFDQPDAVVARTYKDADGVTVQVDGEGNHVEVPDEFDGFDQAVATVEAAFAATDPLLDRIAKAPTRDACAQLWRDTVNADPAAWTAAHTAAVQQRLTELPAAA